MFVYRGRQFCKRGEWTGEKLEIFATRGTSCRVITWLRWFSLFDSQPVALWRDLTCVWWLRVWTRRGRKACVRGESTEQVALCPQVENLLFLEDPCIWASLACFLESWRLVLLGKSIRLALSRHGDWLWSQCPPHLPSEATSESPLAPPITVLSPLGEPAAGQIHAFHVGHVWSIDSDLGRIAQVIRLLQWWRHFLRATPCTLQRLGTARHRGKDGGRMEAVEAESSGWKP